MFIVIYIIIDRLKYILFKNKNVPKAKLLTVGNGTNNIQKDEQKGDKI